MASSCLPPIPLYPASLAVDDVTSRHHQWEELAVGHHGELRSFVAGVSRVRSRFYAACPGQNREFDPVRRLKAAASSRCDVTANIST